MPRTPGKPDTVAYTFSTSVPIVRWKEAETRESPKLTAQLAYYARRQTRQYPVSSKVEGKDWHQGRPLAPTHALWHTHKIDKHNDI